MAKKHDILPLRVGYTKASNLANRFFTCAFSLLLLFLSLPVSLVIALMIKIQDGGPVFYSGIRMGMDKKPFKMYKFRTLVEGADTKIGGDLFKASLSSNRAMLTPSGHFLRETRLDELPQFINTLKGDMDLLGPRPVRPEVYEKYCQHLKGYDKRFAVRPGLIGFSQLFTPHSAPKKIRNLIDSKFLKIKHRYSVELALLFYAFFVLTYRLVTKVVTLSWKTLVNLMSGRKEQRVLDRMQLKEAFVHVTTEPSDDNAIKCLLKDINEEFICACSEKPLPESDLFLALKTRAKRIGNVRETTKTARCTGKIVKAHNTGNGNFPHCYLISYTPVSPLNFYLVHQYFMHGSVAY